MFAIENVEKTFPLLEEIEKDRPCFSQREKQMLYRIAFHKEDFGEVQRIIMQAAVPHLTEQERNQILSAHEESLPKPPSAAASRLHIQKQHLQLLSGNTRSSNLQTVFLSQC